MSSPKWLRWVLATVVAVVVVVVGGRFAIHLVQGKSAAPLTLPTVTTTSTVAGAPASSTGSTAASPTGAVVVDGAWNVSSGSTAGYRIKETLFGQSNTATGRTSAVTGNITIAGTTVTAANLSVDLTQVSSDRSQRDGQFQGRIMNTSSYPTAKFALTKPIQLSTLPANGVPVTEQATGDLTMHGVTKSVTFQVAAQRNGATIQVQGSIPITFADYNIANPSGGPATTGDSGTLEFLVNFSHS